MALVHCRIKRVIYLEQNNGWLNNDHNILSLGVNHFFEIFHFNKENFNQIYK
jgi:hypothetical protein